MKRIFLLFLCVVTSMFFVACVSTPDNVEKTENVQSPSENPLSVQAPKEEETPLQPEPSTTVEPVIEEQKEEVVEKIEEPEKTFDNGLWKISKENENYFIENSIIEDVDIKIASEENVTIFLKSLSDKTKQKCSILVKDELEIEFILKDVIKDGLLKLSIDNSQFIYNLFEQGGELSFAISDEKEETVWTKFVFKNTDTQFSEAVSELKQKTN